MNPSPDQYNLASELSGLNLGPPNQASATTPSTPSQRVTTTQTPHSPRPIPIPLFANPKWSQNTSPPSQPPTPPTTQEATLCPTHAAENPGFGNIARFLGLYESSTPQGIPSCIECEREQYIHECVRDGDRIARSPFPLVSANENRALLPPLFPNPALHFQWVNPKPKEQELRMKSAVWRVMGNLEAHRREDERIRESNEKVHEWLGVAEDMGGLEEGYDGCDEREGQMNMDIGIDFTILRLENNGESSRHGG
ncbi:hypothetical protein TWF506_004583 [Arthrobotrys conoides]|uniref:Uncharacterized protein n=1 Tax=Arthrobotrys conoides TaxID=74498 RepID=A0AAN8N9M1_9PEZI